MNDQLRFPDTDPELKKKLKYWRERAEKAEYQLEVLQEAVAKAICSTFGHNEVEVGMHIECARCGETL